MAEWFGWGREGAAGATEEEEGDAAAAGAAAEGALDDDDDGGEGDGVDDPGAEERSGRVAPRGDSPTWEFAAAPDEGLPSAMRPLLSRRRRSGEGRAIGCCCCCC